MKGRWCRILLICLIGHSVLQAQESFYDPAVVREIRMAFTENNWKHLLDSLFLAGDGSARLKADVRIDGHLIRGAGVRYKGFSSWNAGEVKNPFNIELDYSIRSQHHRGFSKIKLSNVIHDPSFVRETLSYRIARNYMPAPEAGYANLYINDTLIGLYTNIESVDKEFVLRHYGSDDHPFFKGDPLELVFPFGENANLAFSHGTDSNAYIPYYKIESESGWSDLYRLIRVLGTNPDSLEEVLNIDRTLWMHAFNYALCNLDSYIAYAQNYYLYQDDDGRFNPVVWDLNMSFGSFRNSDGSTHFLGLTIPQVKTLDPLAHLSFSVSPRPLMKVLFSGPVWQRMYMAHLRTIIREQFASGLYLADAAWLQECIRSDVAADPNKFYSYRDFLQNLDTTVGASGNYYPGIRDLVEDRLAYLQLYPGISGEPLISGVTHQPEHPARQEVFSVTAGVEGAIRVFLAYREGSRDAFVKLPMADDGMHGDAAAGDGIYGCFLSAGSPVMDYYIYAENDSAGAFLPERAENEFFRVLLLLRPGDAAVNEVMIPVVEDLSVVTVPWAEILNCSGDDLDLSGLSLTDDPDDPLRWQLPDTVVKSGSFLLVRLDGLYSGAPASLSPDSPGGKLLLNNLAGERVDSAICPPPGLLSLGRYPNGYGPFRYMKPTPAAMNLVTVPGPGGVTLSLSADGSRLLAGISVPGLKRAEVFSADGRLLTSLACSSAEETRDALVRIDIGSIRHGCYLIRFTFEGEIVTRKFCK